MSIDFATLQGLTIPEGVVTQIADASGVVLWSVAPATVDITITDQGGSTACSITYNGVDYTNTGTITANVGDVIHTWVKDYLGEDGAYVARRSINTGDLEILAEVYGGETTYDYVVLPTTREITFFTERGSGYITFHEDL